MRTLVATPDPDEPYDAGGRLPAGVTWATNTSTTAEFVLLTIRQAGGEHDDDPRRHR